jgi:hypothetical protein
MAIQRWSENVECENLDILYRILTGHLEEVDRYEKFVVNVPDMGIADEYIFSNLTIRNVKQETNEKKSPEIEIYN